MFYWVFVKYRVVGQSYVDSLVLTYWIHVQKKVFSSEKIITQVYINVSTKSFFKRS